MFNGRLGEDCGIYKPNTTYHTTVDCFLGSQSIMQLVEILKVLEFDPMLADVHCGLHAKFWFICLSKGTIAKSDTYVALGCAKPGKWDTEKKCENADQINVGNIIALIEKVQDLVVDDIDMELKQIFIDSSFKVFPQRKKKNLYPEIK